MPIFGNNFRKHLESIKTSTDYRHTLGIYSYEDPLKLCDYFSGIEILLGEPKDIEHLDDQFKFKDIF